MHYPKFYTQLKPNWLQQNNLKLHASYDWLDFCYSCLLDNTIPLIDVTVEEFSSPGVTYSREESIQDKYEIQYVITGSHR